jgi:hypothetical protein
MREFASLKVSNRLAAAGYKSDPVITADRQRAGSATSSLVAASGWVSIGELLMWLLSLDSKEVAAKMGLRTLAENGTHGALRVQKTDSGEYIVQLYRPMEVGTQDVVLADALGLLVCRVMKEMEAKP